jgi:hypothetical protein
MPTLLLNIVTPSLSTAQVFFLIAIIILIIDILFAIVSHPNTPAWGIPALGAAALLFIALGLLWHP